MHKNILILAAVIFLYQNIYPQNIWTPTSPLSSAADYVPALTSNSSGTVLASSWNNGVYRTTNDGITWEFTGLSNGRIYDLASAANGDFFAFASNTGGHFIYRSTNDGISWNEVYTKAHPNNYANGGGVVFFDSILVAALSFTLGPTIGNIGVDIIKSTDYGATWQHVILINGWGFANDLLKLNDGRILAATSQNGVSVSFDLGSSWQAMTSFPPIYTSLLSSNNNGDIFICRNTAAASSDLIFKSTDNGGSWQSAGVFSNGNGGNSKSIYTSQGFIYAAVILYGPTIYKVIRSKDNGLTWEDINDGIPSSQIVYSLTGYGDKLFAGTQNGGVYKRTIDAVPVELISFTADVKSRSINLNWITASETNNKGFEISKYKVQSKKYEVNENAWEIIAFVEGKGTTTEKQFYSFVDDNIEPRKYSYRLKQIDYDGSFEYSKEIEVEVIAPVELVLYQNYPNPFNPTTKIKFAIPGVKTGHSAPGGPLLQVSLKIFDLLGNEIATLIKEEKQPGEYEVNFDASNLSSGVYFYQLSTIGTAESFIQTSKMVLMR